MTTLFNAASMNLQEFNSNSEALLRQVDEEARTKSRIVKLLGVIWDSKHDSLKLAKRDLSGSGMSKRSMLHTIASIFDPLGLFLPCTLRPKLIIQKLWDMDLDWDKPTPLPIRDEWNESILQLDGLFEQTIPRFVGLCSPSTTSIVVFCDASAKAYATAVYIRIPSGQSHPTKWTSNLVFAKSRLTPKSKAITLPRLELLAMTIGARAGEFVRKALHSGNTTAIHLFTDARVVLNWLETKRLLAKFVAYRVQAIRSMPNSTFHHVSTEENPADYCTRGKSAAELFSSDKWWHGPSFLSLDVDQWPTRTYEPMSSEALLEIAAEVRPCELMHTCTFANVHRDPDRAGVTDTSSFCGIKAENTSCLRTLLRITVIVIKFVKLFLWTKLSNVTRQRYPVLQRVLDSLTNGNNYTSKDQKIAKNCWVASVQRSHFSEVIGALQSGRKNSLISQLGIREDENGLLRSYSRLDHADLPSDTKHPKLLPKSHHFTTIVIEDIHTRLLHSGVSHTLSEVRREFWVPQGRAAVRRVLQTCVPCRRSKGPPFALPNMPPWPRERLECQAPFQSTGLDYLGPISVKVGDVFKKTWICLFTCLVVRAIHLEVVSDCTAKEFLDCLIRFVSRRGTPSLIISDNAPQFRTTKGVLDRVWHSTLTDPSILSYCADNGIKWRFTIELAPWQGGFYERLVQVVKRTMRTAIGRRLLSWTEFITLMTEVEAVVNTRPITYVPSDSRSQFYVLRPVQFLCDLPVRYPNLDQTDVSNAALGEAGKLLVAYWKCRHKRRRQIWDVWYSEYLLSLRERGKTKHRGERSEVNRIPDVNEVVLSRDDDIPRGNWKLARVNRHIASRDGQIRAVELELPNKSNLRRTINFCYPLEIPTTAIAENTEATEITPTSDNQNRMVDDEDFHGFTPEEVQRSIDAVLRVDEQSKVTDINMSALLATEVRQRPTDQSILWSGLSDRLCTIMF